VKIDLSDLEGYSYPERVFISERLGENEAFNVIKELAKNKALGLNKIPNKILKRVANAASTLITRIF
jgi:5,10-methenyltetrahydromethanopterin hydrogenase